MNAKKIIIMSLIFIVAIINCVPNVNATIDPDVYKPGELTENDYKVPFSFAGTILKAIVAVGIVISLVTTMILGIKYMIGSAEEKAEYKQTMVPIIVGMAMLFSASVIVSIIYNIVSNI
jgi:hypothetical protein